MDNPFDQLRVLVERMAEILQETAPGLTIADTKFDPARKDGPYPHPDLMHVTFLLDPDIAFAAPEDEPEMIDNRAFDTPLDEEEQRRVDEALATMVFETTDERALHDQKQAEQKKAQQAHKERLQRDLEDLRNPDNGIGLD